MTVGDFASPSITADHATGSPQTVRDQNLQMVVARAQDQLRPLTQQRQEIAERIAVIKRTIHGLALLYGQDMQPGPDKVAIGERRHGITNACRAVLNRADTPLSTHEAHTILQRDFPDLFSHSQNCFASLVTILNRLVKYGEVDTFLHDGNRLWRRHQSSDPRSTGPIGG
jgi:hypothetical protein